jgi:hypothetical protein
MSAWFSRLVRIETRLGPRAEAGFFIGQLGGVAGLLPNRQRGPDRFAFKKTCLFEFARHVQPKAGSPIDLLFCRAD